MKRRILSVLLAVVMLFSLSAVAFADTTNDIPVEMYQKCIDDTPEGHYLADVILHTEEDGVTTTLEALYLPVSRTRTGQLSTNIYVYYTTMQNKGTIHVLTYHVTANFEFNGTSVSLVSSTCGKTYQCGNIEGYTVSPNTPVKQYGSGILKYNISYSAYYNGAFEKSGSTYGGITCDQYGNIGYI